MRPRKTNSLAVIDFVLSNTLRLFHPFLPFITEELWHGLGYSLESRARVGSSTIIYEQWPTALEDGFKVRYGLEPAVEEFVRAKYELISLGRNLRREGNIPSSKKVKFVLKPSQPLMFYEQEVIKILLNAEVLSCEPEHQPRKGIATAHSVLGELYLPLEGLIDVSAEKERLTKELARIEGEIQKVESKLNTVAFLEKAPPLVLEEHKKRLADWQAKRAHVEAALRNLGEG